MSWFIEWFMTMTVMKAVGLGGQAIFGSRFFFQWYASERAKRSVIPVVFWYISIVGGLLTLIYAVYKKDPVFILAQLGGLVIYGRNLMLVYRDHNRTRAASEQG